MINGLSAILRTAGIITAGGGHSRRNVSLIRSNKGECGAFHARASSKISPATPSKCSSARSSSSKLAWEARERAITTTSAFPWALLSPSGFSESPLDSVPHHAPADPLANRETEAWSLYRCVFTDPKRKRATDVGPSLLVRDCEILTATEPLLREHERAAHTAPIHSLDDGQSLPATQAAALQDETSRTSGHPLHETVLALARDSLWLPSSFGHNSLKRALIGAWITSQYTRHQVACKHARVTESRKSG